MRTPSPKQQPEWLHEYVPLIFEEYLLRIEGRQISVREPKLDEVLVGDFLERLH